MKYKNRLDILESGDYTLAPIWKRSVSMMIDIVVLLITYMVIQIVIQMLGFDVKHIQITGFTHLEIESESMTDTGKLTIKIILACIPVLYFTLCTYFFNGQTIGKKLLKIQVVSIYHHKIGFWHCLERSLGYAASSLELGLGFIQAFWNPNRMALHDKIGDTVVVNK
jgi:uncharacterized RDD family membrane protein YckC